MTNHNQLSTDLDIFFNPLVGTPEASAAFKSTLIGFVADESIPQHDPHNRLILGVDSEIARAVANRHQPPNGPHTHDTLRWHRINHNAHVGAMLTLATVKAIGEVYQKHATVPQGKKQVNAQTLGILKHMQAAPFNDEGRSAVNFSSLRHGLHPHNPLTAILALAAARKARHFENVKVSRRSFVASADTAGQLSLAPKHPLLRNPDRGCPAAFSKVERGNRHKNALPLFMQAIGEVAIEHVFPRQFEIV